MASRGSKPEREGEREGEESLPVSSDYTVSGKARHPSTLLVSEGMLFYCKDQNNNEAPEDLRGASNTAQHRYPRMHCTNNTERKHSLNYALLTYIISKVKKID